MNRIAAIKRVILARVESMLAFATQVARQAGDWLQKRFSLRGSRASLKSDRTVVTESDSLADDMIAQAIHERFPEDALLSEELQPFYSGEPSSRVWVIDPLDGTVNFSLGLPIWGISIACLVEGFPEIGVLYFPALGELYTCQRGKGAFFNGEALHLPLTEPNQPVSFFSCCSRTHRRYQVSVRYKTRILGSAAYTLCLVARGAAILGFEATPKIWDIAGGWLLVTEAGGVIETLDGSQPFPLTKGMDYSQLSYPTLSAATPEVLAQARTQIVPKSSH